MAAIVLVAINPNRQIGQVRDATRRSDINTIYKALEQYLIDTGNYPSSVNSNYKEICNTGTEQVVGGVIDCTNKADLRVLVPDYLASIPTAPSGGIYRVGINSNNKIAVYTIGENSQFISVNFGDPHFANVSLLLRGDGTNGSTTIVDNSPSPKTVTVLGNAQISSAQSKFGGAIIALDGAGDYLTISHPSSSFVFPGDFTVEVWAYRLGGNSTDNIYTNNSAGAWNSLGDGLNIAAGRYEMTGIGSVNYSSGVIPANVWTFLVVTRQGSSVRMFINGVLDSTRNSSATLGNGSNVPGVGLLDSFGGTPRSFFFGNINELRVTKGIARYTASFTPPTAPFPDF